MTIFSLQESVIVDTTQAISPNEGNAPSSSSLGAASELFARATWTGICEPGDAIAGLLVNSLGAIVALEALVERWSIKRIMERLIEAEAPQLAPADLEVALARWSPRVISHSALIALRMAARCKARLVIPSDDVWPSSLNDLGLHAPLALWVRGGVHSLQALTRSVALVGARAATAYGEHIAMNIAAGISDLGFCIVSGAAYGIDGMAHRAALASAGNTVAFLAGGVDRFYPTGHDSLLNRIIEVGAVISELPCGSPPTKWRFLQRNRLLAASALGTVVVEAGLRSGSLNTAAHAASLGRPLGAVPGQVTSAMSAGCHRLLREFDATCVTSSEDVVQLVSPGLSDSGAVAIEQSLSSEGTRIVDALSSRTSRSVSDIARRTGLSIFVVTSGLGVLNIDGFVRETTDGWKLGGAHRALLSSATP